MGRVLQEPMDPPVGLARLRKCHTGRPRQREMDLRPSPRLQDGRRPLLWPLERVNLRRASKARHA